MHWYEPIYTLKYARSKCLIFGKKLPALSDRYFNIKIKFLC